ncbi:unnamed protein product (macronuclear) [Paramecium tetraurelia]|uniref:FCP1 homology domain-containing protein n=1 Tax=Paramecium tetraurelia TaxID=5888 RepID=A0DXS4_PARTE|nr:uncharacterized protein GSPATT00021465001 [Paramecium tetraurelia]CAK87841.1 unnamed protein product [Paramecium tetraurelia]|eukprot:XP_001455238.1 hypothetical protein (macronuclear) [Paramecium tetraurelia strain d4-2]
MKTNEKDEILLCKFQNDIVHNEKLIQQNQENYVIASIYLSEQQTQIPSIQASQNGFPITLSQQEKIDPQLGNNKKFQEQSLVNIDDLLSKSNQVKCNIKLHESSSFSQIFPLMDDNLTCTSQNSSFISLEKQKWSIQTSKKIKKQKNSNIRGAKTQVSKKQITEKCKTQRRTEKVVTQQISIQNDQQELVQVPSTGAIIHQEAILNEATLQLQNQYYMHNLIGYLKGTMKDPFMAQMYLNHFSQLFDNLQKSKLIVCPAECTLSGQIQPQKSIKVQLNQEIQKTLIIDLDETLVHCNEFSCLKSDFFIPVIFNEQIYQVGISIRPYAQQFLRNMAKDYEIMVFTASNPDYANKIIDYLDPQHKLVSYRLFRDDCIQISNNCHIKDLRILNRNMKDIVLVDNSAYSFAFQVENGIPIIPYLDDKNDKELLHLQHYLQCLNQFDDVRSQNNKIFNLKTVQNCVSIVEAIKELSASFSQ